MFFLIHLVAVLYTLGLEMTAKIKSKDTSSSSFALLHAMYIFLLTAKNKLKI